MLLQALVILWVALATYRVLVLSLPFFWDSVLVHPFLNVVTGAASDLTWILLTAVLGLALARRQTRTVGLVALGAAIALVLGLAVHMRYVEHFGMTFRLFHAGALHTGEVWLVGARMVLTSWRVLVLLAVSLGGPMLLRRPLVAASAAIGQWSARRRAIGMAAAVLLAVVCNAVMINLRTKPGMHAELRYSVYTAFFYAIKEARDEASVPIPTPQELASLRTLLTTQRSYFSGELGSRFPLWQKRIPTGAASSPLAERVRTAMRETIAQKRISEGPWNVVVVISESLRAKEIAAVGSDAPNAKQLSPALSKIAGAGVAFTEVISAGLRTHIGQVASQCSLYASEDFTILQRAPMNRAVCLSDIFARRGYETRFFYPADNHFDNQDIFYQFHHVREVAGEESMPKNVAHGGWGASDHALFDYTLSELEKTKTPFHATVLTLTNHAPHKIPEDAPPGLIDASAPIRDQLVQYVDWSVGDFYDKLMARFPRTVFVLIADHGRFWEEELGDGTAPWALVRSVARIPWLLVVPGIPAELQGTRMPQLSSNTDVPPTLLSLLGWEDEANQFMGEDAFSRRGPVYIDWQGALLALRQKTLGEPGAGVDISYIDGTTAKLLSTAARYNQLAPDDEHEGGE